MTQSAPAAAVTLSLNGEKIQATFVSTERDRRHASATLGPPEPGRGFLLAWPRARYPKIEPNPDGSFALAFLDAEGKVLESHLVVKTDREGVQPKTECPYALLLPPGLLRKPDFKPGDKVEIPAEARWSAAQELPVMKIGDVTAHVELSISDAEKQHGLMFRPRMSADDGMLFVYGSDAQRNFWMGNTLIPLDLGFFRSDGTLVNVNETPMYPDPRNPPSNYATSGSEGPATYVLEMNLGWFKQKGLTDAAGKPKPGVKAVFPPEAQRAGGD